MVEILGIKFAPLFIPLKRRLQTFAIIYYVIEFVPAGLLYSSFFIYLLFTRFYFLTYLYIIWYIYDRDTPSRGGRRNDWFREGRLWRWFRDFFPVKLIKTSDLSDKFNYIFVSHPHGVLCFSSFCNFGTEANDFSKLFPNIKPNLLTLDQQFRFPIHRELVLFSGACSASKESMNYLLKKKKHGQALVLLVGGAAEALEAIPNTMILRLNDRKGFIKIALKNGAHLVPVISFGENDVYIQTKREDTSFLKKLQLQFTKYLSFSPPIAYGRGIFQYTFGLLPFRRKLITVVGKPIEVTKIEEPTIEDINALHSKYIECLTKFFNQEKRKHGYQHLNLQII